MLVHCPSRMAFFLRMIQYQSLRVGKVLQMPSPGISHRHQSFDAGLALSWSTTKMIGPPSLLWKEAVLHSVCEVLEECQRLPKGGVFSLRYSQVSRQHLKENHRGSWRRGSRRTYKISKLKRANDTRALVQSKRRPARQMYCPWLEKTSFREGSAVIIFTCHISTIAARVAPKLPVQGSQLSDRQLRKS